MQPAPRHGRRGEHLRCLWKTASSAADRVLYPRNSACTDFRLMGRPLTVQFYVFRNVHWPMFEELFHYLGTRPDVGERVVCIPSLTRLRNGQSHALAERLLELGVPITTRPNARPVDVTFIADTV